MLTDTSESVAHTNACSHRSQMVGTFDALHADGFQVVPEVVPRAQCNQWLSRVRTSAAARQSHSDVMWSIREHEAITDVFARVWGCDTDKLCTGYDGAGYRKPNTRGLELGWHLDQGPHHEAGMVGVQAVLCLTNMNERTGGTAFLKGSHTHHSELCERACTDSDYEEQGAWEFVDVDPDDPIVHTHETVQPHASKGDILIWDSRTVHCVLPPLDPTTERAVVYLSMLPAARLTPQDRVTRRIFYEDGVSTTHWPTPCVDRGEKRAVPSVRYCEVSAKRRALIG